MPGSGQDKSEDTGGNKLDHEGLCCVCAGVRVCVCVSTHVSVCVCGAQVPDVSKQQVTLPMMILQLH